MAGVGELQTGKSSSVESGRLQGRRSRLENGFAGGFRALAPKNWGVSIITQT